MKVFEGWLVCDWQQLVRFRRWTESRRASRNFWRFFVLYFVHSFIHSLHEYYYSVNSL